MNPCPNYPVPAFTQENYNALAQTIAQGVKEVYYSDKRVVYQSLDDMIKILNWMGSIVGGCGFGPRKTVGVYDSGLQRPCCGSENEEIYWRTC